MLRNMTIAPSTDKIFVCVWARASFPCESELPDLVPRQLMKKPGLFVYCGLRV